MMLRYSARGQYAITVARDGCYGNPVDHSLCEHRGHTAKGGVSEVALKEPVRGHE